jgi:hypothetical protein
MSHERPVQASRPKPHELFGFTEQEALDGRVDDERLYWILQDERSVVEAEASYNNYGQFLCLGQDQFLAFPESHCDHCRTPCRHIRLTFNYRDNEGAILSCQRAVRRR